MSLNRARQRFDWIDVARRSALRAGFEEVRRELQGESFRRPGEVSPRVRVFFQRVTSTETAPQAVFGICIDEFESAWLDRLQRTSPGAKDDVGPPFALHVANVASLRPRPWVPFSPTEQDVAAVEDWLGRAFEYAKRLPSSIVDLVAAIEADRIVDHNAWAYLGHPVKVRGFVQWLQRVHGVDLSERLLPLLEDRTEPYDVRAMLGDEE